VFIKYNPKPFTWDRCKVTNDISFKNKKEPEAIILKTPNSGDSAHPVSLRSLHLWRMPEMIAPRALVFRPLAKGNEDSGNEIWRMENSG